MEQTNPRIRKRGRKPKKPLKSINEIREKFKNDDGKMVFPPSSQDIKDTHNKTQIPFGSLNITVHEPPEVDTSDLRKKLNKKGENASLISKRYRENSTKQYHIQKPPLYPTRRTHHQPFEPLRVDKCERICTNHSKNANKLKKKRVYKILYNFTTNLEECGEWPIKTDILCWWCSHAFDTIPIPGVMNYDEYTKRYHLNGIFCSWECSAAYTFEKTGKLSYLYRLCKEWSGEKNPKIKPSAPKTLLKAFGGYLSIEEYRQMNLDCVEIQQSTLNKISYINQEILEVSNELTQQERRDKFSTSIRMRYRSESTGSCVSEEEQKK